MKKIIVSALMVTVLIVAGCKSGGGDPRTVLVNFFDALAKKDFTAVKKYTTKASEGMMSMVQMGMQNTGDNSNQLMNYQKENLELGTAVIDGDKATIPVKDKKSGEMTDFTLRKESGDWKVAFDKSTLMEMAGKKMKEHGFGEMNMDSISGDGMKEAKKMMDSANKILKDAEK